MSVITDFDIATDLKVEMLLPQDVGNTFVLGISLLDGPDVLGTDSAGVLAWQDLACEVNRVQTSIGGSVASNVYYQADAGRANIQLQSWEFDPNNYTFIRPSTQIRVRVVRGGYSFIIWKGFVNNIQVQYAPEQKNQITIDATDTWSLLVNRRFNYDPEVFGGETILPDTAVEAACFFVTLEGFDITANTGPTISAQPLMTTAFRLNVTFGSVISDILTSGLGFIWVNPNDGELYYRPRSTGGTPFWTIGNNHGDSNHLCMADLSSATRSDDIYNSVVINQKYEHLGDPKFSILYSDRDSIDLYGERSDEFDVDLAREEDATTWSNLVFAPKPITLVQDVTTPAIDRSRNLTEAIEFMPGDIVGVVYENDDINIDSAYTVTRVRHSIDVNNWFTTLEVWKEF